jgi:t-SNARE complex subunit (syntaxin)
MATARGISDLVSQREKEVVAVAKSIEELAGLFKDLSLLIVEQGSIFGSYRLQLRTDGA